jgi:hypothetical protein
MKYLKNLTVVLMALAFVITGCGLVPSQPTAEPAPTDTPAPTNTAIPTDTPVPTDTPTPAPTSTFTPTPDATATAEAQAAATAEANAALVRPDLEEIGLTTEGGYLGWMHDPLTIKVDTYLEEKPEIDYPEFSAADFVLQTDVTWNTASGLAGCALIVRSEADVDKGKQYRIYMMRLQNRPLWDIEYFNLGRWQSTLTDGVLDAPAFFSEQDSTNRVTVVAQGEKLTVYGNGEKLGSVTDKRLTEGSVYFMAWQESGETTCTFTNSWLWVLGE